MPGRTHALMGKIAHRGTRMIAVRFGETFPMYSVTEYPKSGGSWLSYMIGDALQLPVPTKSVFPIGCSAVLHNHWTYSPRLRRVGYLYRDGRDIAVSLLFHTIRIYNDPHAPTQAATRAMLRRLFGDDFDQSDSKALLPKFIEHVFARPFSNRQTWPQHVRNWHDPEHRPHVAYVSYEQLRSDPCAHLKRVVEHLSGEPIEDWRIKMTVEKFSIKRQTGRAAGQEDRSHFIRKGIAGDWVNHFTPEAARVFNGVAGETLIQLGYEPDDCWVERVGQAPKPEIAGTVGPRDRP